MTITFPNGKTFAPRKSDGNKGVNTYKKMKNSVVFYNVKDKPFAALISNRSGIFFVSCSMKTDGERSRIHYMFGLCSLDCKLLGLDKLKYSKGQDFAKQTAKKLGYI